MTGTDARVAEILTALKRRGNRRIREEMLTRYGVTAPRAFGVSVGTLQQMAGRVGRDHDLALALWDTGWYEARMLTAYIDEAERVTSAQMDRWAREFDNWGICDTLCFALWDRTPHAWKLDREGRAQGHREPGTAETAGKAGEPRGEIDSRSRINNSTRGIG